MNLSAAIRLLDPIGSIGPIGPIGSIGSIGPIGPIGPIHPLSGYALRVGHPAVLAIGAAALALVAHRLWGAELALGRARKGIAGTFALLGVLLALLAASEVELVRPADRMNVVVAFDTSRSIELVADAPAFVARELRDAERAMRKDDRLGVLKFAASAALSESLHARGESAARLEPTIARDASDLEAAIRRGVDEVLAAGGGRVVLVSDGVSNRGDALSAAARARSLGVPIDVVPLVQRTIPDIRVVTARGPTLADEGETFEIRAVVHTPIRPQTSGSSGLVDVEVTVRRDGEPLATMSAKVAPGEDVLRFKDRAPTPGLHRYDVHVRPLDADVDGSPDDNEATAFVRVRGPSTVLVLQRDEAKAEPLRRALEGEGFRVVVRGRFSVPYELAEFAAYDLIVLADLSAHDLVPAQMDAMATYVRDFGGGVLLLGSDQSLGPGGYSHTPIEELSPVTFDLTREKRRAQLTELIVIDFSGSMGAPVDGGRNKLDLANEAAARSASLLGNGDRLGVWHVDTEIYQTIPIGPVGDAAKTARKIRSVAVGGGGIFIDLSLEAGYKALAKEGPNLRHLLMFSDGADAEQRDHAPALVKKAAAMGITTSVISLGEGVDSDALQQMAKLGGGRFYLITDARKLPAVFAQETILAARSSIHEEDFAPRLRSSSPALKGIHLESAPNLRGYLVTQMKPRAQRVLDGLDGDPLLATWAFGLGHTAAWMSDFTDVWAGDFSRWAPGAQLMAQLARETARKSDDARVRLETSAHDGVLHIAAEPSGVGDVGAAGLLHLRARVQAPDGSGSDVELLPLPGGGYAADVNAATPGAYVVRAIDVGADGLGSAAAGLSAAMLSRADELRPTGSDVAALSRIAELSGGVVTDRFSDVFSRRNGLRPTPLPLAPYLLPAALACLLLGVAGRRLGVPSALLKRTTRAPLDDTRLATNDGDTRRTTRDVRPARTTKTTATTTATATRDPRAADPSPNNATASLAMRRKEASARTAARAPATPQAPVIVRAQRPARVDAPEGASASLADLARKKRARDDASKGSS